MSEFTWGKVNIMKEPAKVESWRDLINDALMENGDSGGLIACTLTEEELDIDFSAFSLRFGYGKPFTAWSSTRVYFPCVYDGHQWVGSVPRNPCDEATEHQGGG